MNSLILDFLKTESSTRTGFGARAYDKVIKLIKNTDIVINTTNDLDKIEGMSKGKIYEKICDLINGKIEYKLDEVSDFKTELASITGIGPAKVKELTKMGITSMDILRERADEVLNDKQLLGLKYHQWDSLRIPRDEIDKHYVFIGKIIKKLKDTDYEIVGSYRRGHMDSGDIDILITNSKNNKKVFTEFVETLKAEGYLIDDLAYGNVKYMGYSKYCGVPRRIDILYCSPEEYPFSILYFTGSGEFNKGMRKWCLTKDYTLNEHGLYHLVNKKKGNRVDSVFKTEKDIFDYFNLSYVEPQNRINFTEN